MRSMPTRKRLLILSALLPVLCSTGCASDRIRFVAPPPDRTAPVAAPAIPPATTPCAFDPARMCNTDEETAGVIAAYDAALAEANRKLAWMARFFTGKGK